MNTLDPARREELAEAVARAIAPTPLYNIDVPDAIAPLLARWLAEMEEASAEVAQDTYLAGKADGAAEVRARVEAVVAMSDHEPTNRVWHEQMQRVRAALADPEGESRDE